ncbi:MAG TPA: transposase [Blastocatellia bacterium]
MSYIKMPGKKSDPHTEAEDPPRRRANKARGRGTYEKDRPPIFILVARNVGEVRYFVRKNADSATCLEMVRSFAPAWASVLYTDELPGYGPVEDELSVIHYSVRHSKDEFGNREWAKDVDGDGIREVHCNSCEGAGAGLRTYLRVFRGVHKKYLARYVALYQVMTNAKRISGEIIRQMCYRLLPSQSKVT